MNYKDKISDFRKNKSLIKNINQKEGWIRIFSNNLLSHELVKFQIMWYLKKMGWSVFSEAEFVSPFMGRADIFALHGGDYIIIEVLDSETEAECLKKCKTYPGYPNSIRMIKVGEFDINTFKL